MKLGSFKKPTYELLREKELHTRGIKCITIWETSSVISQSSKSKGNACQNHLIVTGGYDGAVKIWSYNNLEYVTTLNHHTEAIWDVKTFNNLLASCGTDGKVAVLEYTSSPDSTKLQHRQVEHFYCFKYKIIHGKYLNFIT